MSARRKQIVLSWYVKHQHSETFTPEQFAEFVAANRLGNPDNLDAVYNQLDRGDWEAEEALTELARSRNWVDTDSVEIIDLVEQSGPA